MAFQLTTNKLCFMYSGRQWPRCRSLTFLIMESVRVDDNSDLVASFLVGSIAYHVTTVIFSLSMTPNISSPFSLRER